MISDEQLIEELKEFAEGLGRTPTKREMDSSGPYSSKTYHNHFGSWNNSLQKAGMDINETGSNISREGLLKELKEFADKIGKTPTKREMSNQGPRSSTTYENYFGSWNNALQRVGLDTNHEKNPPKERLIADLQEFAERLGKTPTWDEVEMKGPWHIKTYLKYFGSWNEALREAGLEINRLAPDELVGTSEHRFGTNWYKQRQKVVERDRHRCRVCGDSEFVHVHHIKPRKEFDDVSNSNTLNNLITLCPQCHGTFEGRWQDAGPDEFEEKAKELYSQRA